MTRLLILVEGQSEEIFVRQTLAPHLAQHGVYLQPPIVLWTKRLPSGGGYRGGALSWQQIQMSLKPLLRDGDAWITTLLDFYGLPEDFPGLTEVRTPGSPSEKVVQLQKHFADEMKHPRFIPFFALHEFEAWLFSSTNTVEEHFAMPQLKSKLDKVVQAAGAPELIDHGADTHPKAQLRRLVETYKETSDGATLLAKIGIAAIRTECPHFNSWLTRLEKIGNLPTR